ncbi:unnamed protein product [Periconia digitata]|uniref:Protein kinase domain-containing protein n=1 Tax=Periconia digitata TaxID=1303443 RepID=A0A9W4UM37_9PLEO|nr:unnamed protein product [Periconia digitata]
MVRNLKDIAQPITPPRSGARPGEYECDIEHGGILYSLRWTGNLDYPSLINFPYLPTCEVSRVEESPSIALLRRKSTLEDFGSHACVRRVHSQPYPIVKLAHPDTQSTDLIQYEYTILKLLAPLNLPIPAFSDTPIFDHGNICGYQMEELFKLSRDEILSRSRDISQAVESFHRAGYSHGDLSQSNIMKTVQGNIVLIDFSCSGLVGTKVPACIPGWAYGGQTFDTSGDKKRLNELLH